MTKLLKLLKALKAKGFATATEKQEVKALYKTLEGEDKEAAETVAGDVQEAEALPEVDPNATAEGQNVEKGVRDLFDAHGKRIETQVKANFETLATELKGEVTKHFEEEKQKAATKVGIYHPEVQEKRKAINSYMRNFMRATLANDTAELQKLNGNITTKELTTDSSGSPYGGYVVDRELSAEIRHLVTEYGVARREMTATPLSKHSYDANSLATDVTVGWVSEAGVIASTQIVLGRGSLTLKKIAAIVTLTRELLEDEEIDLFTFIGARVAEGFAKLEDRAFFVGTGGGDTANGEYTGIMNALTTTVTMAATKDTAAEMTADDLLDLKTAAPQSVRNTGKYYMSPTMLTQVRKLKDLDGRYIYQEPSAGGAPTIWGRPVVEVEDMPTAASVSASEKFVIYADLKRTSILGYKNAISADHFNAGVIRNVADNADINLITTDREAIRWVTRVGVMHILPTAGTVLVSGTAV